MTVSLDNVVQSNSLCYQRQVEWEPGCPQRLSHYWLLSVLLDCQVALCTAGLSS